MPERTCTLDDCDRRLYAKGMCASHYQKARLSAPGRATCTEDECDKVVYSQRDGLCRRHYCDVRLPGYWQAYEAEPANKARRAAQGAAWLAANRDRVREAERARRAAAPDAALARTRAWRARNRGQARLLSRQYQARRRAVIAAADPVDYAAILVKYGMFCHICSGSIANADDLHFDHVIPLAKGGPHAAENIRPAHATCNLRKGDRLG